MQAVIVVILLLWASSTTARRSAATQGVAEQCVSLSEAPMQENGVYLYNELYYVTKNPFLWKDSGPIPFDKMHPSLLVSAACELVLDLHDGEMIEGLDEIESETTATWGKIVEPLELLYDSYSRVTSVFELLVAVNQTSELEAAVGQGMTLARDFIRRLQQSSTLYASLKNLRNRQTTWLEHTHEQLQALDYWISRMEEGGANNPLWHTPGTIATLKRLDDEEAALKRQFLNNIKQGTAAFYLTLRDGEHLRGVPRSTLAAMAAEAQRRNLTHSTGFPGAIHPPSPAPPLDDTAPTPEWGPWTVTFDPLVYESMMAYCPDRRLRQLIYQSYENRASQAPWDNVPVVERMLQVRHNRARLLGSAPHTKSVGNRQTSSPANANRFLDSLLPPVASAALRTMLRIVGLMMDRAARGEDVWGELCESSNLESWNSSGARLVNSEVSSQREPKFKSYGNNHVRPWGIPPRPTAPRVNSQALGWAENFMQNTTLPQDSCLDVFASVTPHLRQWDLAYWTTRLESSNKTWDQRSESPPEDLSHYLPLSRVLSGAFGLLNRYWGAHVVESVRDKPPVWHPDVRHFRLFNGTHLLGSFFFDPFARPNKLSAPFAQTLVKRNEAYAPGKDRTPIAVMSTSIKAPGPSEPALLQFSDVQAVFHELGHVIQILVKRNSAKHLAEATTLPLYISEMFSQFYDLWPTEDRTLSEMAKNYKTHAPLSTVKRKELVQTIKHMRPFVLLEKIYLSKMDLLLHSGYTANATHTALTHGHQVARETFLLPYSTNNCDFCTLVGSFGSGHGAGYYSYLWSAVHASDATGYFEEVETSNDTQVRALGSKMAEELLVGGMQKDVFAQYEIFRGRPV